MQSISCNNFFTASDYKLQTLYVHTDFQSVKLQVRLRYNNTGHVHYTLYR